VARGRRITLNRSESMASSKFVTTTHSSEASSDSARTTTSIIGSSAMGIFGLIVSYPSLLNRPPRPHEGTTTRIATETSSSSPRRRCSRASPVHFYRMRVENFALVQCCSYNLGWHTGSLIFPTFFNVKLESTLYIQRTYLISRTPI